MKKFRQFVTVLTAVSFINSCIVFPALSMCDDYLFTDYKECTKHSQFFTEKSAKQQSPFHSNPNATKNSWFSMPNFGGFFSYLKSVKQHVPGFHSTKNTLFPVKSRFMRIAKAETRPDNQEQPQQRTTRILTIDGGGVRGIIPAKILSDMETCAHRDFHSDMHLAEYFDFMAGTSTGGIIALGLNVPDKENDYRPKITSNDLFKLYRDHSEEIFPSLDFLGNVQSYVKTKHDKHALEKHLQEKFGNIKLSHSISNVLITAYDAMQDLPIFFKSYDKQKNKFAMKHVARATAAAPTYLSGAELKDSQGIKHHYVDGGVFANNPTFEALLEVRRLESEGILPPATRYVILSLGTGECPSSNYWDKIKEGGKLPWASIIPFLMMNAAEKLTQMHLARYIEGLKNEGIECEYVRIQSSIALENMRLDDGSPKNIQTLIARAGETSGKYNDKFINILRDYHEESKEKEILYINQKSPISYYNLGMLKKKEGKIEESIQWLTKAAEQHHKEAQYMLAWLHAHHSKKKDPLQAKKWYADAAKQGHREALYKLGRLSSDLNEKKEFFEGATKQGHVKAPYELALILEKENNDNEAERRLKESANRGHVKALYKLGLFFEGKGRINEAEKQYKDAVESGHSPAELSLNQLRIKKLIPTKNENASYNRGRELVLGLGVEQDYLGAIIHFSKAAEEGNADAQFQIGLMYAIGLGVPKDKSTALDWLTKGAQNNAAYQYLLGSMLQLGGGVPKDEKKALEFKLKSASKSEVFQYIIGKEYENGESGMPKDEKKAIEFYTKAADQGYENAKIALARLKK